MPTNEPEPLNQPSDKPEVRSDSQGALALQARDEGLRPLPFHDLGAGHVPRVVHEENTGGAGTVSVDDGLHAGLSGDCIRRLCHPAQLAQKDRANALGTGGQPGTEGDRPSTRHGELAASWAKNLGLADARIVIEPLSRNTRQHPIEALKLTGVDEHSEIASVTSDFQLRRSLGEF